jgi:CBS domain-containing protein/nucleotide-binding universal stress UspA family protein
MYRHVLVGLDESAGAWQAFETALDLAETHGATLTLLSVEEHVPDDATMVGDADEIIQELETRFHRVQAAAIQRATGVGVRADAAIAAGSVAQMITRTARAGGYNLIVVGASRHGSLWGSLLGTTADRIVEIAPCTVLVVRHSPLNVWAGEVMQRQVLTVRPETPLATVVELLIQRGVKAVPVLDSAGGVAGIITGGDLLERAELPFRLSLQRQIDPETVQEQMAALAASGRIASDIMTSEVTTIDERTPLREAARLMAQQQIKRLPVIDAHGRLAGILSRSDVLRHIAAMIPLSETIAEEIHPLDRRGLRVADLLDPHVSIVTPDTPLDVTVGKVVSTALRRVVVVDSQRRVIGIVTDADLIGRISETASASLLHVLRNHRRFAASDDTVSAALANLGMQTTRDVMRRDPIVIAASASIVAAIQAMTVRHIKRLPVVDAQDRLVGMIDRQAILRALSQLP